MEDKKVIKEVTRLVRQVELQIHVETSVLHIIIYTAILFTMHLNWFSFVVWFLLFANIRTLVSAALKLEKHKDFRKYILANNTKKNEK